MNVVAQESFGTSAEAVRHAGAQVFVAGDDQGAKNTVSNLLHGLGFQAVTSELARRRSVLSRRWEMLSAC